MLIFLSVLFSWAYFSINAAGFGLENPDCPVRFFVTRALLNAAAICHKALSRRVLKFFLTHPGNGSHKSLSREIFVLNPSLPAVSFAGVTMSLLA